jgi:hypothetical protein
LPSRLPCLRASLTIAFGADDVDLFFILFSVFLCGLEA